MEGISQNNQAEKLAKFSSLGLDKWLMKNVSYLQYSKPTEIQQTVIPKLLKDNKLNLIGIANTGTGKTASFCLPILDKLAMDPKRSFRYNPRADQGTGSASSGEAQGIFCRFQPETADDHRRSGHYGAAGQNGPNPAYHSGHSGEISLSSSVFASCFQICLQCEILGTG